MKLETHTSRLTPTILSELKNIIHDITTDSFPVFNVRIKGIMMNMGVENLQNLMDFNILEDCSIYIDTEGEQHEIIIRDTFEKI